jgi:hypothetical protein
MTNKGYTGSIVEVINIGETYDAYESMAERLSHGHYKKNWVKGTLPEKGSICKLINSFTNYTTYCYIIDIETNQGYVIGRKGIKIIKEEEFIEKEEMII